MGNEVTAKKPDRKAAKPGPQEKFTQARRELSRCLIERDEEVDLVLTALVAQEHVLLVGPPGCAKSLLADSVLRWMSDDAKRFSVLLTKFTTPNEVFGPVSVKGLQADEYRRITTGKMPECEIIFIDEVFKASSAILNTLLQILNERKYDNGEGVARPVPLQLAVMASNEWPGEEGRELGALFDRILFRKRVRPISTRAGRDRLLWEENHQPEFTHAITPQEIRTAHQNAKTLAWDPHAKEGFLEVLNALAKEGIVPGDRRQFKSVTAVNAYAYVMGEREKVRPEHLEVLMHTLWDDPAEQPAKAAKVVARVANPVGSRVNALLLQVEDIVNNPQGTAVDIVPKLQSVQHDLGKLPRSGPHAARVDKAISYVGDQIKVFYDKVLFAGGPGPSRSS